MKNQWKAIQLGLLLLALPLMATAAVSANQWISDTTPIQLDVDTSVVADTGIGINRVHQVALSANGTIAGRIAAFNEGGTEGIADLTVYFMQAGKIAAETKTADDGSFAVQGLEEGAYSFVATGENGFAAYGVHVVPANSDIDNVMEAAAVAPNFAAVKQILSENLPEQVASEIVANSVAVAPTGANRVKLVDGTLNGNVHALLGGNAAVQGTKVHILKGDEQVASVDTDEKGSFSIGDLEPGVYGFVATAPSGFAAVSFEAVQDDADEIPVSVEPSALAPITKPAEPISYQDGGIQEIPVDIPADSGNYYAANSLNVCLTCGNDVGFVDNSMTYDPGYTTQFAPVEYAGESIGCGGACGAACGSCGNFSSFPSCGNGGGFGGGFGGGLRGGAGLGGRLGRLGRLALIGGTVVGIVAIADDGEAGVSSPVSPE